MDIDEWPASKWVLIGQLKLVVWKINESINDSLFTLLC